MSITNRTGSKLLAVIIVMYCYIVMYYFGTSIDLGTVTLSVLLPFYIFRIKAGHKGIRLWFVFMVYAIIITFFDHYIGNMKDITLKTSMLRYAKLFLGVLYISIGYKYIDKFTFLKALRNLAVIACIAVIIQTIVYYAMGRNLIFYIPRICANSSLESDGNASGVYSGLFRPRSIFYEPGQFSHFMMIPLYMAFFDDKYKLFNKYKVLFSVSLLLSTSGQAYVVLSTVVGIYFIIKVFSGNSSMLSKIAVLILVPAAVIFATGLSVVQLSVGRLFSSSGDSIFSSAITGRLSGFGYLKSFTTIEKVFGRGFGDRRSGISAFGGAIYYNGISAIISGLGYFGLLLYTLIYIYYFRKVKKNMKYLVAIIYAVHFSSNLLTAQFILPVFTFLNICIDDANNIQQTVIAPGYGQRVPIR